MADWQDLAAEVETWAQNGLRLPLWWRDDDATHPTPQLEKMLELSQKHAVPIHLAVIPARAHPDLAAYTQDHKAFLKPLVHGWAHVNQAPPGSKRSEFGTVRDAARADAAAGMARLQTLFGAQLFPVFVPPWNRIDPAFQAQLPELGFRCLSTFNARKTRWPAPGLEQINTHLDPVDWRGTRGLADETHLLATLCQVLHDRRFGRVDAHEPFGLLTHHLIHGADVWAFCDRLLDALHPIAAPVQTLMAPN